MAIVFGSPEALQILEQDRQLRMREEAMESAKDEIAEFKAKLSNIQEVIESIEEELSILYGERSFLQEQLVKKGAKI